MSNVIRVEELGSFYGYKLSMTFYRNEQIKRRDNVYVRLLYKRKLSTFACDSSYRNFTREDDLDIESLISNELSLFKRYLFEYKAPILSVDPLAKGFVTYRNKLQNRGRLKHSLQELEVQLRKLKSGDLICDDSELIELLQSNLKLLEWLGTMNL